MVFCYDKFTLIMVMGSYCVSIHIRTYYVMGRDIMLTLCDVIV